MADLSIGKIPKAIGSTQIGDSIITDNGVSGVTVAGALLLGGSTSGSVALRVPAIAGSGSITFPSGTTNFTTSGGAGMVLQQATLGGPITVAALAPSSLGGLGAGVATWLATPSSANLLAAVTDETGSGALVFANSPVLAGNPTAPTPALSDSDTSIATTAYVKGQNYLAGNQSITLSGDIAGTGTTAITTTLATVLSTPGTFQGLTVNSKGLVTAAVNQNYASVTGGPLTAGSVLFAGAGGTVTQDNTYFYHDSTNKRTGLGTAAPQAQLDVGVWYFNANAGIRVNTTASGAGMAVIETIGRRDDANTSFSGRIGIAHRRLDGVGIQTGSAIGILAFGAQWGADTTEQQAKLLYPASIMGITSGSFTSATAMPTALSFRTGAVGDDLRFYNLSYGTERLNISATGNVGLGNFSPYGHTPQAMLHIGCAPAAATVRSYNVFNDAANGEWAYMGDWGSPGAARYGTDRNGTGAARPVVFLAGGIVQLDYGWTTSMYPNVWTTPSAVVVGVATPTTYQLNGISFNQYYNSGFLYAPGSASHHAGMYSFDVASGAHIWWSTTTPGNAGASAASLATMMAVKKNTTVGGPMLAFGEWVDFTAAFPALRRYGTTLEVRLADDSGYAPLNAGALFTDGSLIVGTTAATARTHNTYTDGSNSSWAYLGDWGKTANVATFGTDKNGTGTHRPMALMAGGIEAMRISTLGETVFNSTAAAAALHQIAGTYSGPVAVQINPTMTSTSTGNHYAILVRNIFTPTGASASGANCLYVDPTITSAAVPISGFSAIVARVNVTAGTTGAITSANMVSVTEPTMNSTPAFGTWAAFNMGSVTHGNGLTTGTVNNRGLNLGTISAGAAGGNLSNRAINLVVPAGGASAGTAINAGIYMTGNGGTASGSGVVTNYALFSDSAALSAVRSLRIGTGAANFLSTVEPFLYITSCNGTPTAVPRDAAIGAIAIQYDTAAKKLWVYDQPTATWKGVVVA